MFAGLQFRSFLLTSEPARLAPREELLCCALRAFICEVGDSGRALQTIPLPSEKSIQFHDDDAILRDRMLSRVGARVLRDVNAVALGLSRARSEIHEREAGNKGDANAWVCGAGVFHGDKESLAD